jgi:Ca2+-binding EF-hand superfamily protein
MQPREPQSVQDELSKSPLKIAFEEFEDEETKCVPGKDLGEMFKFLGISLTPESLTSLLKTIHADDSTPLAFADVLTLHRNYQASVDEPR